MKLAIIDYQNVRYNGITLEYQGLGGSETSNIRIGAELVKLGYEVDVYCLTPCDISWQGVNYYNHPLEKEYDICIHVRGFSEGYFKGKYNFLLNQDYQPRYSENINQWLRDRKIDKIFAMSKFHKKSFMELGIEDKDIVIFKMGIRRDYFVPSKSRKPKIVYTSTPYRGLEYLKYIFPKIKKALPEIELHLFGGYNIYGENYRMEQQNLYDELGKIDGVKIHGNVTQKELAVELCESLLFIYPCNFPETGCIALKEAITAGLPVIITPQPMLKELIIDNVNGYICGIEAMADKTIELLKNKEKWQQFSDYNLQFNLDWSQTVKEMDSFFRHQENELKQILIGQIVREKTGDIIPNAKGLILPQGCRWDFVAVAGKNFDEGREQIMDIANGYNKDKRVYDYLFFLDDDVVVSKNSLVQLLRDMEDNDKAAIIGCWYSKKYEPIEFAGVGLNNDGKEINLNKPEKKLYKALLVPTGSMLIDLNKIRKIGKPYFELKYHNAGEDTYFCQRVISNGFDCFIDGRLMAIHKDLKSGKEYFYGEIDKKDYCYLM